MNELDFTIEFNSEGVDQTTESQLFTEVDNELRQLAEGHNDLTGAAVNIRQPAQGESSYLYEATIVAYIKPEQLAASEKNEDPVSALKGALSALKRQVRQQREKKGRPWQKPGNQPTEKEILEVLAAEEAHNQEEES